MSTMMDFSGSLGGNRRVSFLGEAQGARFADSEATSFLENVPLECKDGMMGLAKDKSSDDFADDVSLQFEQLFQNDGRRIAAGHDNNSSSDEFATFHESRRPLEELNFSSTSSLSNADSPRSPRDELEGTTTATTTTPGSPLWSSVDCSDFNNEDSMTMESTSNVDHVEGILEVVAIATITPAIATPS